MFQRIRMLPLLLCSGLLSGCVLPGPDRPVGAMEIQGRVSSGSAAVYERREIVVIRKQFEKQRQFDALYGIGDPACNPVRRHISEIGPDGRFSLVLPSFLGGDPIWVIPPLGTLVSLGDRADKRGLVLLLKTPSPNGQVYEIDARGDIPTVRILKGSNWRFQRLSPSEAANIRVTARTMTTNLTNSFSMKIREVGIELMDTH